jgi:hypothetical protein
MNSAAPIRIGMREVCAIKCIDKAGNARRFRVMRPPGSALPSGSTRFPIERMGRAPLQIERFESLVDELSAAMARAPADEIDKEIEHWLRELVLALNVDRGAVWEREASDDEFVGTHWWARPGIQRLPRKMRAMEISPWATAQSPRRQFDCVLKSRGISEGGGKTQAVSEVPWP